MSFSALKDQTLYKGLAILGLVLQYLAGFMMIQVTRKKSARFCCKCYLLRNIFPFNRMAPSAMPLCNTLCRIHNNSDWKSVYSVSFNDRQTIWCWWGEGLCACLNQEISRSQSWSITGRCYKFVTFQLASTPPNQNHFGFSMAEWMSLANILHLAICFPC